MSASPVADGAAADDFAIVVEGLSKCYEIYARPRDRLAQSLLGARRKLYREFWALHDVSFELRRGQALGIIGQNGSGKSTLLQLICGTLTPSAGDIRVNGRVAALLELGSGFNPEMTGRENVVMSATVLGLSRKEIAERFDRIVEFSEIEEFLDQPIKTYSSGMIVRLAFSVNVNVDADIIVIDEALAVGDARFQLKCAKAMDSLRDQGKTLLFVSHDANAVTRLCNEAILLERGRMLVRATPKETLNIYSKLLASNRGAAAVEDDIRRLKEGAPAASREVPKADLASAGAGGEERAALLVSSERSHQQVTGEEFSYGGELGRIDSILVTDEKARPRTTFHSGERVRVDFLLSVGDQPLHDTIYALTIKDLKGQEIYGTNTFFQGKTTPVMEAGGKYRVSFDLALNLLTGNYFLSAGWTYFEGEELRVVHRRYDVIKLLVYGVDRSFGIANCWAKITYDRMQ